MSETTAIMAVVLTKNYTKNVTFIKIKNRIFISYYSLPFANVGKRKYVVVTNNLLTSTNPKKFWD